MLNENQKATLRARYAGWGLEAVKCDLKRPFRWVYGSSERNKFATEWVEQAEAQEARRRVRRKRVLGLLVIALVAQIGILVGLGVIPSAG